MVNDTQVYTPLYLMKSAHLEKVGASGTGEYILCEAMFPILALVQYPYQRWLAGCKIWESSCQHLTVTTKSASVKVDPY